MKDRRPRKLKKQLKKRYDKMIAAKILQTAMTTTMSAIQMALIGAKPIPRYETGGVAVKAVKALETVMDCAQSITSIMNSGPKNWREA